MAFTIDTLRLEIGKLHQQSVDGRSFVDPHDLKSLLSRRAIAEVIHLCAVPDWQRSSMVDIIFDRGRVLFGILVWKKWHRGLTGFIEHDALDDALPLDEARAMLISGTFGWEFARHIQWEFLPRVLLREMSDHHYHFHKDEILPFTNEAFLGNGFFGTVHKMSVVPSLQTIFPKQTSQVFMVRKTLQHGKYLEREMETLRILHRLQHPNVVKLLGTYTYQDRHHFLFPLYEVDLETFLALPQRHGGFEKDYTIYTALQGLSSALENIHSITLSTGDHDTELNRIGYHHDIGPANILVDSKTFYLADFGYAKTKLEEENSQTKWKSGLGDYVGPECMDPKQGLMYQHVGRPLDIWSYGCMLSEIAAYIQDGPDGVKSFRDQRFGVGFFHNVKDQYFFRGEFLRPSVLRWFNQTKAKSNDPAFRLLLDVALSMLRIDPKQRPKAKQVNLELSFVSAMALFNAVQTVFQHYLHALQAAKDASGKPDTIQLEYTRFTAWGNALQLTGAGGVSPDDMAAVGGIESSVRQVLIGLLGEFDHAPQNEESMLPSADMTANRRPSHERIRDHIDKLEDSLQSWYRENPRQAGLEDLLIPKSYAPIALDGIGLDSPPDDCSKLSTRLTSSKLENLRPVTVQYRSEMSSSKAFEMEALRLTSSALDIATRFEEGISIGQYNEKNVIIEWVTPTAKWSAMTTSERCQLMQLMAEDFRQLSGPGGLRVLECIGFVTPSLNTTGPRDSGFVFAYPRRPSEQAEQAEAAEAPKKLHPISLYTILKQGDKLKYHISLGARLRLAHMLVSYVHEMHLVGWLHEDMNSKNVVFFQEELKGGCSDVSRLSEELGNPYLLNYHHSWSSPREGQTEGSATSAVGSGSSCMHASQNPEYVSAQQHSCDSYDYHSVGTILLEIGGWYPLEKFLANSRRLESNPPAFRDELVKKYAPRLRHLMGSTYANATLACLCSNFGSGSGSRQKVLEEFYENVVGPLRELSTFPV
ncbi:kinase-like domain-containing protein [Tricharina praecox]|uniref:kinase-like domain-containing protein n=1 Tax=Tricharina praecox TaxID=43433 RepID=UPI00221E838C|nr:kinase-like domain-containing protein [Tricharina praecox]KAI5846856.1 kinase-like domain-containing protein [Tricharina praecox]